MFPEFDAPRRGRPTRRIWILALVTLIAAGAWWIGARAQEELTVVAYLDEVRNITDDQAPRAEAFRSLLIETSALQIQREAFTARLDQLEAEIDADLVDLEEFVVSDEAFATNAFLSFALERWAAGLGDFRESALALRDSASASAREEFAASLGRLQVADAMYVEFQAEATALKSAVGIEIAPFVDVEFVEPSVATPEGVDGLIQAILDNEDMKGEIDVRIVSVEFDPAPAGDTTPEGADQIPATEQLSTTVVVRNDGTDPESGLEVRIALADRAGTVLHVDSSSVADLDAGGGSTAVTFTFDVESGIVYELEVELARAGGGTIAADTTNFVVSPPSG